MKNLILFALVLALVGCAKSKEDFPLILEGNYVPEAFFTTENVIMYTQNGQTTDTALIRKFIINQEQLYGYDIDNTFLLDKSSHEAASRVKKLSFHSPKNLTVYYNGMVWDKAEANVILNNNEVLTIEHIKTDTLLWNDSAPIKYEKYPHKISANLAPLMSGYNLRAINFGFPLKVINHQIYLPYLTYMFYRKTNSYQGYINRNIMNLLTPELSSQLGPNDTVITQIKLIKFVKE